MQTPVEFAMTFLLNAVWQVALITLAAALCTRLLRGVSARYKYMIWVAALVSALLLPVVTSISNSLPEMVPTPVATVESSEKIAVETFYLATAEPIVPESTAEPFFSVPIVVAIAIFATYALFVLYRSANLLRAWIRTRAIVRNAHRAELPETVAAAVERCKTVIGERDTDILFSDRVPVPVTIGNRRPVIILPEHFLQETDQDVLITALGHEMVHVERRDYAFNLLFEISVLPLSFHPAAAYTKRRIAHMRELCCDEIVATRLLKAEAYARSLLNIAGSAPALNLSPIITVGITDADLEVRIMSLLKRSEMSFRKKVFLVAAAVMLLAIPLVAAAFISPTVSVDSASTQPEAQPSPPEKEESDEKVRREEFLKKVAEVKQALADPNLSDERRAELMRAARKIETELIAIDQRVREEELTSEVEKVAKALQDASLNEAQKYELRAMEVKLRSELHQLETGKVGPIEFVSGIRVSKEDNDGWDYPPDMDADMGTPRSRQAMEKLKESANITMEQAMELALASYPGKLIEKALGQIKGEAVYRFFIIDAATTPDSNALIVDVSGIDGRIINTARSHVTVKFRGKP